MNTKIVKISNPRLLNIAVYGIVVFMAGVSAVILPGNLAKAAIIALCICFCLVHAFGFPLANTSRRLTVLFIIQGIIILSLLRLSAPSDIFILFFYILALEVVTVLPILDAAAWIACFYLFSSLNAFLNQGSGGAIFVFSYAAAFLLTAAFGHALRQAEIARRKNEELLIELKTTQHRLQELAVAEERTRMAREMHDSLGHRLTVTIVQLEGAQRLIPTNPERAAGMVGAMREEMKEALAELRRTVSALRTPTAWDGSLATALWSLSQNFQHTTGITTNFTVSPGFPELPEGYRKAFYRMAQEALTNIQRHAMAQNAWMRLGIDDDKATLMMEDDGRGIDRQNANQSGSGLLGLRERVEQLEGEMRLMDRQGGGLQLIFTVPLPKEGKRA